MIFILIGIVFTIIFYMVYTKFLEYRDERYNWIRPPLPLWAFLLLIMFELIPVVNIITIGIILFVVFGMANFNENIRFRRHSKSKILDFFNYDLNANNRKNN